MSSSSVTPGRSSVEARGVATTPGVAAGLGDGVYAAVAGVLTASAGDAGAAEEGGDWAGDVAAGGDTGAGGAVAACSGGWTSTSEPHTSTSCSMEAASVAANCLKLT